MSFPFNIYLLAWVSACLVTFASVPCWRRWSLGTGLVDDPGHRKIHTAPVPLAGGLAVFTGIALPLIAGALAASSGFVSSNVRLALAHGFQRRTPELVAILSGAAGMLLLGWIDDKRELRPGAKFAGQFVIASLVAAAGVRITLFVPSLLFSYAITVLWILTITNALNIIDNMNGLCGGLGAIGSWFFGLHAAVHGQYLVALFAFLVCGALTAFLVFNFPKASVFLGDSGSHLVGYWLAVLAILPHFYSRENPNPLSVLDPLLVLFVPLLDLVSVIMIRWRLGRPIYVGDTNHLSHRLVRKGFSRSTAVLCLWSLAALTGALSFLL